MLDELAPVDAIEYIDKKGITNGSEKAVEKERPKPTGLVLSGVSASWQVDPIVPTLRDITITVKPGEFVGIAGLVGSGKVRVFIASFKLLFVLSECISIRAYYLYSLNIST